MNIFLDLIYQTCFQNNSKTLCSYTSHTKYKTKIRTKLRNAYHWSTKDKLTTRINVDHCSIVQIIGWNYFLNNLIHDFAP